MTRATVTNAEYECKFLFETIKEQGRSYSRIYNGVVITAEKYLSFLENCLRRIKAGQSTDADRKRREVIRHSLFKLVPKTRQQHRDYMRRQQRSPDENIEAFDEQKFEADSFLIAKEWARDRERLYIEDVQSDKRLLPSHRFVLYLEFHNVWPDTDRLQNPIRWFVQHTGFAKSTVALVLHELARWKYHKRGRSNGGARRWTSYTEIVKRAYERDERRKSNCTTIEPLRQSNCTTIEQFERVTVRPSNSSTPKGAKEDPKARRAGALEPVEVASLRNRVPNRSEARSPEARSNNRPRLEDKQTKVTETISTKAAREARTAHTRDEGSPLQWQPFFEKFYTDFNFGTPDALTRKKPGLSLDDRFCYQRFHQELWDEDNKDFTKNAIEASVARFQRKVMRSPFPGESAALSDVKRWLRKEKKGVTFYEEDPDEEAEDDPPYNWKEEAELRDALDNWNFEEADP